MSEVSTNAIPLLHPVTAETVQHYALNAGILLQNFDVDKYTDAITAMAAILETHMKAGDVFGATKEGITITEGRETWTPEHNGQRMPYVGEVQHKIARPSIKGTLVELTPANIKLASGAADVAGKDTNKIIIQPRATFLPEDYIKSVTWLTNYADKGIIGATIDNALCTSGLSWSVQDNNIATAEVTFAGHSASPVFNNKLPIRYWILLKPKGQ